MEYIVVELGERSHHLCKKVIGSEDKYTSLMNGRSRQQAHNLCQMLNEQEKKTGISGTISDN